MTPYPDEVNELVARYVEGEGFDIVVKNSFRQVGHLQICRVPPDDEYDAGCALGTHDLDGLFISCTGRRGAEILQPLEDGLGKPGITSSQTMAWDSLRLVGYDDPLSAYGRLLMS